MGKHKYIETPEKMWELFCQYREWVEQNPLQKKVEGNKGFIISQEKLRRPLTMEGFEVWCFENDHIADLGHYFANTDGRYESYRTICELIKKVIRADQITGGMVGLYHHSITQRLNGLVEKTDNKQDGKVEVVVKYASRSNTIGATQESAES